MPKQLITVIGLVISIGIVALGVVLVAVPMLLQSFSTDGQTASVAASNDVYETQLVALQEADTRQAEIDASVATLRAQIPATGQLDDVFEVVGNAAAASGVTITSVTAGDSTVFVARKSATDTADQPDPVASPSPDATTDPVAPAEGTSDGTLPAEGSVSTDESSTMTELSGRQQVDFTIQVKANDMNQVTAFLDALRAGPRLFSSITALAATSGEGIEVAVDGVTYLDSEG
jgi:hypothetical protein